MPQHVSQMNLGTPLFKKLWKKSLALALGGFMGFGSSAAIAQPGHSHYTSPKISQAPICYDQWGRPVYQQPQPYCPPDHQPYHPPHRMPTESNWHRTRTTPRPLQPAPTPAPSPMPMGTSPAPTPAPNPMPMGSSPAPVPTPSDQGTLPNTGQPATNSPAEDFASAPGADFGASLSFNAPDAGSGADAAFNNAPAMIGDHFGTGGSTVVFTPPTQQVTVPAFQTVPQMVSTTNTIFGMLRLASDPNIQANFVASQTSPGGQVMFSQGATQPVTLSGITITNPGTFFSQNNLAPPFPGSVALNENMNITNAIQMANPGATVLFVQGDANEDPANPGNIYFVDLAYDVTTTRTDFVSIPVPGGQVIVIQPRPIVVTIPSPSASGFVVGRQKISENTSPIPRDRVFTNYSFFEHTNLTRDGVDVHRITPGFEKTFFNGTASFEMRFPFASTLNTDIIANGQFNDRDTKFGNINMAWKQLIYQSNTFGWSIGTSLTVPTGDDVTVALPNGQQLVKVENESVHVLPFTGFLYVPDDRLFIQGYVQADFDTNGNTVYVNNGLGGLRKGGVANDQTYLFADLGMGYWMYQNPANHGITGLAPIVELHYNRTLQDADTIRSGPFTLNTAGDNVEIFDAVIGATAKIGDRAFLTAAYTTPIGNGKDQQFDGEARVTFNWYFGGSVNNRFTAGGILP